MNFRAVVETPLSSLISVDGVANTEEFDACCVDRPFRTHSANCNFNVFIRTCSCVTNWISCLYEENELSCSRLCDIQQVAYNNPLGLTLQSLLTTSAWLAYIVFDRSGCLVTDWLLNTFYIFSFLPYIHIIFDSYMFINYSIESVADQERGIYQDTPRIIRCGRSLATHLRSRQDAG